MDSSDRVEIRFSTFLGEVAMSNQWSDRRLFREFVHQLEELEPRVVLNASAMIVDVSVGSSEWSAEFLEALRTKGLGGDGYSILASSGDETPVLPWKNIDQIKVRLDGGSSIQETDLLIKGLHHDYAVEHFEFSSDTHTATWYLSKALISDQVVLHLNGDRLRYQGIHDVRKTLAINVSVGDVDLDGRNTRFDYVEVDQIKGATASEDNYDPIKDIDGSGDISLRDLHETMHADLQSLANMGPTNWGSSPSITLSCGYVGAGLWWFTGTVTDPDGPADGWDVDFQGLIVTYVTTDEFGNYEHFQYLGTSGSGMVYAFTEDPEGNNSNVASCYVSPYT